MLASDYVAVLRVRLFDPAPGAGWTNSELLGYLNEATRATCQIKSDAYTVQGQIAMSVGVAQELPAAGIALFDITENLVTGRSITLVDKAALDEQNRFWPAATREREVKHFATDPRSARRFYVTPPNDGTGSAVGLYGALPAPLVDLSDDVLLQDIYQPALLAYALSRAYLKPSQRKDPQQSSASFNEWATLVGARSKTQQENAPRVSKVEGV